RKFLMRDRIPIGGRFDGDAESLKRPEMRPHGARAEIASARLRDVERIESVKERPDEHEDGARARRGLLIYRAEVDGLGRREREVVVIPLSFYPDRAQDLDEPVHFFDSWNFPENGGAAIKE